MKKIELDLEYAENILKVLDNHISMGFAIVSQEIKDIVSEEAYNKLTEIFYNYHNANCGPFNRALKKKIEDAKIKNMIEGILYSAQYLTIDCDQPSLAQDLMRESGYKMDDFLKIQKTTGYHSRRMNEVIRETFKINKEK